MKQETETTSAATLRLAYVSPRFPSVSLVFEQNELLGLLENGVDLRVFVCRHAGKGPLDRLHGFASRIVPRAYYFNASDLCCGFFRAVVRRPRALLRILFLSATESLFRPQRVVFHVAEILLSLAFFGSNRVSDCNWIHADFAQGSAATAFFLSLLTGIPFSFNGHAFDVYSPIAKHRASHWFFSRQASAAALIFGESEFAAKGLAQMIPLEQRFKVRAHKGAVRIPSAGDLPRSASRLPYVVALGRLDPQKGFDVLVRAMGEVTEEFPAARCRIYGGGEERELLESLIAELGLQGKVLLMGVYENDDLPEIFSGAIALAMPSVATKTSQMDGVPTVIYEAMAYRCPVIATRIAGIPEAVLHEDTGLLVEPKNPDELAAAVVRLYKNSELREALAARGRQYCEGQHGHIRQAAALLDCFRCALKRDSANAERQPRTDFGQ